MRHEAKGAKRVAQVLLGQGNFIAAVHRLQAVLAHESGPLIPHYEHIDPDDIKLG